MEFSERFIKAAKKFDELKINNDALALQKRYLAEHPELKQELIFTYNSRVLLFSRIIGRDFWDCVSSQDNDKKYIYDGGGKSYEIFDKHDNYIANQTRFSDMLFIVQDTFQDYCKDNNCELKIYLSVEQGLHNKLNEIDNFFAKMFFDLIIDNKLLSIVYAVSLQFFKMEGRDDNIFVDR